MDKPAACRWRVAAPLLALALLSCSDSPSGPEHAGSARLVITASVIGTPISTLAVEVSAADISPSLVFNIEVDDGVATGTISIPPGSARLVTVKAFDSEARVTHVGSKTLDIVPGTNPAVSIPMVPVTGDVEITVQIGPVSVVVTPPSTLLATNETVQLTAVITAANGDVLGGPPVWATTNPAVATVAAGLVTAHFTGTTTIVATYAGVAGVAQITVSGSNQPPIADAGADQDVTANTLVALTGSNSSDPEAQPLTYDWTQISGPDVTGGTGHLAGETPSFTAPAAVTTLLFTLSVSDGVTPPSAPDLVQINVLRDHTKAVWVAKTGDDGADGTRANPKLTIQAAIAQAAALGDGAAVYIGQGIYAGPTITLANVSLYGGYANGTWQRDAQQYSTEFNSNQNVGIMAINGLNQAIDGLTINAADANSPVGASSYGIFVSGFTGLVIENNTIRAGNGLSGASGQSGVAGAAGSSGTAGAPGCNGCSTGGGGGAPGGTGPRVGGAGGTGGFDATNGLLGGTAGGGALGGSGGIATQVCFSKSGNGGTGAPGGIGAQGVNGPGGAPIGSLSGSGYVPASGIAGTTGGNGTGGGGGGGGGGGAAQLFCNADRAGGGGGGGGGGIGGGSGNGGAGGGGSFGVLVRASTGVTIGNNTIQTGAGGDGGQGGNGSAGGQGGPGAAGGLGPDDAGHGGTGGNGGAGGQGGAGGGGSGGPSLGVARDNSPVVLSNNVFTIGSGGFGAPGGVSPLGPAPSGLSGLSQTTGIF